MNDILARRARRATAGIALSAALVAGIAPVTAIAAETSAPTGAVALQTEDAAAAKEKAYAAMQEALKTLEAAKDAASPEKIAEIDDDIAAFQEIYDMVVAEAAKQREPLPAMQANVDAAQAKYDEAHNRTSGLQAELDKALEALGGEVFGSRAIPQAKPRTSETPNTSPPAGPCRGTKKRPCARWIRMPDRGSLWLLPSGPDQIRNMSSSEPIERARRSVYLTCSRPPEQGS